MKKLLFALCMTMLACALAYAAAPVDTTDENFYSDAIRSYQPVVVEFWASWCGPCRSMSGKVDELAKEYDGKVKFVKVNVDRCPKTTSNYKVESIPTFLYLKDGVISGTARGAMSKEKLKKELGLK